MTAPHTPLPPAPGDHHPPSVSMNLAAALHRVQAELSTTSTPSCSASVTGHTVLQVPLCCDVCQGFLPPEDYTTPHCVRIPPVVCPLSSSASLGCSPASALVTKAAVTWESSAPYLQRTKGGPCLQWGDMSMCLQGSPERDALCRAGLVLTGTELAPGPCCPGSPMSGAGQFWRSGPRGL